MSKKEPNKKEGEQLPAGEQSDIKLTVAPINIGLLNLAALRLSESHLAPALSTAGALASLVDEFKLILPVINLGELSPALVLDITSMRAPLADDFKYTPPVSDLAESSLRTRLLSSAAPVIPASLVPCPINALIETDRSYIFRDSETSGTILEIKSSNSDAHAMSDAQNNVERRDVTPESGQKMMGLIREKNKRTESLFRFFDTGAPGFDILIRHIISQYDVLDEECSVMLSATKGSGK